MTAMQNGILYVAVKKIYSYSSAEKEPGIGTCCEDFDCDQTKV